jgi:hypothetical protein
MRALWGCLLCIAVPAWAEPMTAAQVIEKVLQSDPWGLSGAEINAHALLKDKRGSTSQLAYSARSRRYDGTLSKSLVRFSAPADLAGAGFLQVQKKGDDDDRFLFMPDLKRSRRISGNLRSSAFMGTDFSFADLDRRDLRESSAKLEPDEVVEKFNCYHLDVQPKRADSEYSRLEVWVRKDNFLPVRWISYDKAKVQLKTLTAVEMKQVGGQWFISKSRMTNNVEGHTTDLVLDKIVPRDDLSDDEFTTRALEKI